MTTRFATHPLNKRVESLEQAHQVLEDLDAWVILGLSSMSRGNLPRVLLLPGVAPLLERGADLRAAADLRTMEAVAFVVEAEQHRWQANPELGLAALKHMTGFSVARFNNGPDAQPSLAMVVERFSPQATPEEREECKKAFDRLRDYGTDTPLFRAVGRVLANREESRWMANLENRQALLESLMGPEQFALYRESWLDERLETPSAPEGRRPRM